jgi:hypothetical protein
MSVVALGPDRAAATERAVDGARTTDAETPEASAEIVTTVRLHDQVQVVGLNREVNDAEQVGARRGQRA